MILSLFDRPNLDPCTVWSSPARLQIDSIPKLSGPCGLIPIPSPTVCPAPSAVSLLFQLLHCLRFQHITNNNSSDLPWQCQLHLWLHSPLKLWFAFYAFCWYPLSSFAMTLLQRFCKCCDGTPLRFIGSHRHDPHQYPIQKSVVGLLCGSSLFLLQNPVDGWLLCCLRHLTLPFTLTSCLPSSQLQ